MEDDLVYFGTEEGVVWALDPVSGDRERRFQARGAVRSAPMASWRWPVRIRSLQ